MSDPAPDPTGHYLFWAGPLLWAALRRSLPSSETRPSSPKTAATTASTHSATVTTIESAAHTMPSQVPRAARQGAASSQTSPGISKNSFVLLHNVSHSDVVMDLNSADMALPDGEIMARPKFSCFYSLHLALFEELMKLSGPAPVLRCPVYADLNSQSPLADPSKPGSGPLRYGAGFDLSSIRYVVSNLGLLRFRGCDAEKLPGKEAMIARVYFPLLAILVPRWMAAVSDGEKSIRLISGQGTPLDVRAEDHDNSTYYLAMLMKYFIETEYPTINVEIIHSGDCNLFRYDENIKFVKSQLAPHIEGMRDQMVAVHSDKWKEHFKVTVSFADGSSARVSAINAAMRQYRPSYMHFWQLKSFWHAAKLCQEDIEAHSFEEISTVPPLSLRETERSQGSLVSLVVNEMKAFKQTFEALRRKDNDLKPFWLRKTQKLVLSVLLVETPSGDKKLYRGTNMEVSMPTGSLCAERNVIGSALSDDLSLKRANLRMVAVLSVSMADPDTQPQTPRPGLLCLPTPTNAATTAVTTAAAGSLPPRSIGAAFTFNETDGSVDVEASLGPPLGTPERAGQPGDTPATPSKMVRVYSNLNTPSPSGRSGGKKSRSEEQGQVQGPEALVLPAAVAPPAHHSSLALPDIRSDATSTPADGTSSGGGGYAAPPPSGVSAGSSVPPLKRYNSVIVREGDMNPLKPCGACLEWLRKIAEVNPRFSVITFANAECNAVYVEEVEAMIY